MNLTVELFRAVRSTEDKNKNEEHRLQEWMKDPKDPKRFLDIIPVYLTVLKRKENWIQYIQVLETEAVAFRLKGFFNKKFLFYLLFINSNEELRVKILKYHSSYNPVPFYYPLWPQEGKEISYEFNKELFYIMEEESIPILSFGINDTAFGKSMLINYIINKKFEVNDQCPFH